MKVDEIRDFRESFIAYLGDEEIESFEISSTGPIQLIAEVEVFEEADLPLSCGASAAWVCNQVSIAGNIATVTGVIIGELSQASLGIESSSIYDLSFNWTNITGGNLIVELDGTILFSYAGVSVNTTERIENVSGGEILFQGLNSLGNTLQDLSLRHITEREKDGVVYYRVQALPGSINSGGSGEAEIKVTTSTGRVEIRRRFFEISE